MKLTVREISFAAMGVALITLCSWLSIPMTVPITMQTFAVCLVTALFGLKLGTVTVLAYLLLGAFGVPVFSGFQGGIGALMGVTGGYLVGFLFTAVTVGVAVNRFGKKTPVLVVSMALGILLCYAFGTAWFIRVYNRGSGTIGILAALSLCVFPYLVPDGIKIALAALLVKRLEPLVNRAGKEENKRNK